MAFKDKLNEIFGVEEPIIQPQEQQKDVIELTSLDDFRNNIRNRLNGIKGEAIDGVANGTSLSPQIKPPQPPISCGGDGMIVERQNEIGLDTLKGSVKKMGPNAISEIIAKLSIEKKEVDASTGVATSEFDQFVNGLKQEACEVLLGSNATPTTPTTSPDLSPEGQAPNIPKSPEQKLPDLVTNKL
jgi:hypothetical protein